MALTPAIRKAETCCLACGRTLATTGPRGTLEEGETAPDLSWRVCSTACYHSYATRVLATVATLTA